MVNKQTKKYNFFFFYKIDWFMIANWLVVLNEWTSICNVGAIICVKRLTMIDLYKLERCFFNGIK